jgi:rRNA maturation endonuclease Nob1
MNFYHCFACRKLLPLVDNKNKKCPSCGGTNGEVMPSEMVEEGFERGKKPR